MNVFDKIFTGAGGLGKALSSRFGGRGVFIKVNDVRYDPETGSLLRDTTSYPVDVLPDRVTDEVHRFVDGVLVLSGDRILIVPASDISVPVHPGCDRFLFGDETFEIAAVETISTGNQAALLTILGRRQ